MVTLLTRDEILATSAPYEDVPVPEWGGTVRVYGLSGIRRAAYVKAQFDDNGKLSDEDRADAVLAAFSMTDETGTLLFTAADIQALADKSVAALDRVTAVAKRLSGFSKEAVKAAEKN
jgi:hypothetical protein